MATATELRVPPLAAGDKLTREEFLRRWEAHPEIKLAELVGGLVFMPSPVKVEHGARGNFLACGSTASRSWQATSHEFWPDFRKASSLPSTNSSLAIWGRARGPGDDHYHNSS